MGVVFDAGAATSAISSAQLMGSGLVRVHSHGGAPGKKNVTP